MGINRDNNMETRVSLSLEDFQCLASGGILKLKKDGNDDILISLQDIGWEVMLVILYELCDGKIPTYQNRERQL